MDATPRYDDNLQWRINVEKALRDHLQKTISTLKFYAEDFDNGESARKVLKELGEATWKYEW